MGSYVNWDDVTGRYPKVVNVADADEMGDSFIIGVEAFMNGYLAKVFTVPVTGSPPLLQEIALDLVYCKIALHKDKGVDALRERTLDTLKMLIEGTIILVDSNGTSVDQVGNAVWISSNGYHSAFSMLGTPEDLKDQDELDDLVNERL